VRVPSSVRSAQKQKGKIFCDRERERQTGSVARQGSGKTREIYGA
jgi:hypothetical protein